MIRFLAARLGCQPTGLLQREVIDHEPALAAHAPAKRYATVITRSGACFGCLHLHNAIPRMLSLHHRDVIHRQPALAACVVHNASLHRLL